MDENHPKAPIWRQNLKLAKETLEKLEVDGQGKKHHIEGLKRAKTDTQRLRILYYFEIYPSEETIPFLEEFAYSKHMMLSETSIVLYLETLKENCLHSIRAWIKDSKMKNRKNLLIAGLIRFGNAEDVETLIEIAKAHIKNRRRVIYDTGRGTTLTRIVEFLEKNRTEENSDSIQRLYDWILHKKWNDIPDHDNCGEKTILKSIAPYIKLHAI